MPKAKTQSSDVEQRFNKASRFLSEARASRKKGISSPYGELFAALASHEPQDKIIELSVAPVARPRSAKRLSAAAVKKAVIARKLGDAAMTYLDAGPGLTDLLTYQSPTATGAQIHYKVKEAIKPSFKKHSHSVGINIVRLRGTASEGKNRISVASATAKISSVKLLSGKAASKSKASRKECTCKLASNGHTRSFPGTTRSECAAAAALYGFEWQWECK